MPRKKNKRKAIQKLRRDLEDNSIRFPELPRTYPSLGKYRSDASLALAMTLAAPRLMRRAAQSEGQG